MIINFKREEDSVITLKVALVGTFFLGGLADFTSKIYQVYGLEKFQTLFLLFTFVSAMGVPSQMISLFLLRSLTTIPAF